MGWLSGLAKGAVGALNPVGLIGTVGAGILGGVGDVYSASQQNRSAEAMANKQMDFQQSMSSTAHQREVEDLKKAGLNPLLSVNSGASSPSGAAAPVSQVPYSRVIASAMEMSRFRNEMQNVKADTRNKRQQEWNLEADRYVALNDAEGRRLENEWLEKRNKFFERHPNWYGLNAVAGGLGSASSGTASASTAARTIRMLLK